MAADLKDPSYGIENLFVKNTSAITEAQDYARAVEDAAKQQEQTSIDLYELNKTQQEQLQRAKLADIEEVLKLQQEAMTKAYQHNLDALEKKKAQELASYKAQLQEQGKLNEEQIEVEVAVRQKALEEQNKKLVQSYAGALKAAGLSKDGKQDEKKQDKVLKKANQARKKQLVSALQNNNASAEERQAAWNELKSSHRTGAVGVVKDQLLTDIKESVDKAKDAIKSLVTNLQPIMDEQVKLKSSIDTRLQGFDGKHWDDMSKDLIKIAGTSPLIKQADLQSKINEMVGQGIAFNVEQRAVLDVMSETIADTFSVTNASLVKLVRLQQQDTTAARLGMESALTSFLNSMYETSEFMENTAQSIRDNLYEAEALMTAQDATSFEYQVEKWLGSLYSVGMDENKVTSISSVLGQLASGQISAISDSSGTGTLMIMAANNAGLSISDILNNGLSDSETNLLLQSMVDYLAELAAQAGDSKVIQQQLASVYGLSASDLKAVTNLASSTSTVAQSSLDYSAALQQLNYMASTMSDRISLGQKLSNVTDNLKQTLARSVSSNPALYATYTIGSMLEDYAGGLEFSLPLVMGTGSTQTFSTADIMKYAAVGGGLISNLGNIISSVSNGASGSNILSSLGITSGISSVQRGSGSNLHTLSGNTVSDSGNYIGNSNSSDITSKTLTDTKDETNNTVSAAAEESTETTTTTIDNHIVKIYELMQQVTDGTSLRVAIEADNRFTF